MNEAEALQFKAATIFLTYWVDGVLHRLSVSFSGGLSGLDSLLLLVYHLLMRHCFSVSNLLKRVRPLMAFCHDTLSFDRLDIHNSNISIHTFFDFHVAESGSA
jgi:hypothetical protein